MRRVCEHLRRDPRCGLGPDRVLPALQNAKVDGPLVTTSPSSKTTSLEKTHHWQQYEQSRQKSPTPAHQGSRGVLELQVKPDAGNASRYAGACVNCVARRGLHLRQKMKIRTCKTLITRQSLTGSWQLARWMHAAGTRHEKLFNVSGLSITTIGTLSKSGGTSA